ncbi:MAG TPA: hypothetical protein VHM91_20075 [Verrucomicrobiales bacterium]|jgi:alginate O-acetyltransferase complex protein AlgJ|nr:hypothetical protein [Verrucomicrobiales bacterium]
MNRRPIPPALSAVIAASLLFFPGCKSSDSKTDAAGSETDKDKAKRTAAEAPFYAECAKLGETGGTVSGRDGWLFSGAELLQLSRISNTRAAVGSIADYAQQLRSQNIDLVLVPVPPKALIYPDMISRGAKVPMKSRRPARMDSLLKAAMDELAAKNIRVVDLTPALIAHRDDKEGTAFPRTSVTWSPYGVKIATKEIADAVRATRAGKNAGSITGISTESEMINFIGGLAIGAEDNAKPEAIRTNKIGRITGDKVRSLSFNTSGGSVLLMGDGNVLAWREANNPTGSSGAFCSLADQLSAELQLIPDVLATTNDGRNSPRLRILRERTGGHGMLESTRAVVWVFSALDLTAPNWQRVPLQLQYSEGAPDLKLR